MTPFGARLREIREARGMTLKSMAAAIGVSPAYLSALEHGRRGRPTWDLLQRIIGHLNIIWDEAEALQATARRSHPRVVVDSGGLTPTHVELANVIASRLREFSEAEAQELLAELAKRAEIDARVRRDEELASLPDRLQDEYQRVVGAFVTLGLMAS